MKLKPPRIPRRCSDNHEPEDNFLQAGGYIDGEDVNLSNHHLRRPKPKKKTTKYQRAGQFVTLETQAFTYESPEHEDSTPGIHYRNRNPADLATAADNVAAATVEGLRGML